MNRLTNKRRPTGAAARLLQSPYRRRMSANTRELGRKRSRVGLTARPELCLNVQVCQIYSPTMRVRPGQTLMRP